VLAWFCIIGFLVIQISDPSKLGRILRLSTGSIRSEDNSGKALAAADENIAVGQMGLAKVVRRKKTYATSECNTARNSISDIIQNIARSMDNNVTPCNSKEMKIPSASKAGGSLQVSTSSVSRTSRV
jgi:hypothetical protein